MTARFATTEEIAQWDKLIAANPDGGNIFSSSSFLELKKLGEYKIRHLIADGVAVSVLEKVPKPFGRFWYLPKGPNVTSAKALLGIVQSMKPLAKKNGVFMIRTESEVMRDESPLLEKHGLIKAAPIIPNPSTITLDISASADDLLLSLPQKGRHAIRRAQRDGVTIERVASTSQNCKIMFDLLKQTAEGQFGLRSYNYYETFWKTFERAGQGQLFFAKFNGDVVAAAYAMVLGKKSTYKDGASQRERTTYGASHLLQWEVITWAKENGATLHDFCGSPPIAEISNPKHPHYGIGQFKTAFSKNVIDFIGCYDYVLKPAKYKAWRKFGERIHRKLYNQRTNDYYY